MSSRDCFRFAIPSEALRTVLGDALAREFEIGGAAATFLRGSARRIELLREIRTSAIACASLSSSLLVASLLIAAYFQLAAGAPALGERFACGQPSAVERARRRNSPNCGRHFLVHRRNVLVPL